MRAIHYLAKKTPFKVTGLADPYVYSHQTSLYQGFSYLVYALQPVCAEIHNFALPYQCLPVKTKSLCSLIFITSKY